MHQCARRIQIGLGHGEIRLHHAAFGQAAAGALRLFRRGQRLQIIQCAQRIAAGHRRDAERQQAEWRKAIERAILARRIGDEGHAAPLRHTHILGRQIARTGAAHAQRIPGVDQFHFCCAHHHHAVIGRARWQPAHVRAVHDHRAAQQPAAIGTARSPGPATGDTIIIAVHRRPPHGGKHAAGDDIRIGPDFAGMVHRQPGRDQRRGAADHHAPAGGSIGATQLFKAGKQGGDIGFGPAQGFWHQQAEGAGLRQFGGKIGRQTALTFGVGGAGGDGGEEGFGNHRATFRLRFTILPLRERI